MSAVPSQTLLGPALVQPAGEGADTLGESKFPSGLEGAWAWFLLSVSISCEPPRAQFLLPRR